MSLPFHRVLGVFLCLLVGTAQPAFPQEIRAVREKAAALVEQEQYDEAIALLRQNAHIDEDYYPFTTLLHEAYNCKALRQKEHADYRLADRTYQAAMSDTLLDSYSHAVTVLNYADLLLLRGMYALADQQMDAVLPAIERSRDEYLHYDWSIRKAEVLSYLKRHEEALSILADIYTQAINDHPDKTAEYFSTLGFVYLEIGGHDEDALSALRRSYELFTGETPRHSVLANIALLEARQGDRKAALRDIETAARHFKDGPGGNPLEYNKCLRKKAEILLLFEDRKGAQTFFREYFDQERAFIGKHFESYNAQQRLDYWKSRNPLLGEMYILENDCPELLYDLTLFRRAVSMLGDKCSDDLFVRSRDIRKVLGKDEAAIEFIRYSRGFLSGDDSTYHYAAIVLEGTGNQQAVSFVPLWEEDEINSFEIGSGVRLLEAIRSTGDRGRDKNDIYYDEDLSMFIWAPLEPYLRDKKTVYFTPEGILNLLAVEYLPAALSSQKSFRRMTSTGELLKARPDIGSLKVHIVGNLDYSHPPKKEVSQEENHDAYDYFVELKSGYDEPFGELRGTKEEMRSIKASCPQASTLDVFYEDVAKKALSSFSCFHIGTHAYSLEVQAPAIAVTFNEKVTEDRSLLGVGIALSGANVAAQNRCLEDGLLSAREVCELSLKNLSLVVLSACQSATGRVSDDGPVGLIRGFKIAGAHAIIATLWPVDDTATALLMGFLYENLSSTSDMHLALRMAQEQLRSFTPSRKEGFSPSKKHRTQKTLSLPQGKAPFQAPYYWAPFVLIDYR